MRNMTCLVATIALMSANLAVAGQQTKHSHHNKSAKLTKQQYKHLKKPSNKKQMAASRRGGIRAEHMEETEN